MSLAPIHPLKVGDHKLAGGILGAAFDDDPVNNWVCNGNSGIRPLFTLLAKRQYLPQGFGHVTDGQEGVALWMGPGHHKPLGSLAMLWLGALQLWHGGPTAMRRGMVTGEVMARNHPKEPHYYLFAIGVKPEAQGKGFGKALMVPVLEKADREGMPAYLESSKPENVPIYRSVGFEVTGEFRAAPDAPPLIPMWRKPR